MIVVVNVDPHAVRETTVHLNMAALGLDWHDHLVVHDEVLVECPLGVEKDVYEAVADALADATEALPLKVDGKICLNNYGEGK